MNERLLKALQGALASEHAVIWGYGAVGANVNDQALPTVREADIAHRARRDSTVSLIRDYGGEAVGTEPAYHMPFTVGDHASALRLAIHLEEGSAAAWRFVIGETEDVGVRRIAIAALSDAAVRAVRWRQSIGQTPATVVFPGI